MKKVINILQLYPKNMNLYGDWGNALTLKKRLQWRSIEANIIDHDIGSQTDFSSVDIISGGGGQDSNQMAIKDDLMQHAATFNELANDNIPMVLICGMYQLFGNFFKLPSGEIIKGIGVLDIETHGGEERLIGNILLESEKFGQISGYENHSGKTYLGKNVEPLAKVIRGAGNNNEDGFEGAHYKNIIASYLHGPLLPNNPQMADYLIAAALKNKLNDDAELAKLDDHFSEIGQEKAKKRIR